jgi:hypothetical protein
MLCHVVVSPGLDDANIRLDAILFISGARRQPAVKCKIKAVILKQHQVREYKLA